MTKEPTDKAREAAARAAAAILSRIAGRRLEPLPAEEQAR